MGGQRTTNMCYACVWCQGAVMIERTGKDVYGSPDVPVVTGPVQASDIEQPLCVFCLQKLNEEDVATLACRRLAIGAAMAFNTATL